MLFAYRCCRRIHSYGLHLCRQDFDKAKIQQLDLSALGDEDVRGFDIAMDDALAVGRIQGIGDLDRNLKKGLGIQRAPRDLMLQCGAIQELHDDEWLALVLSDFVNCANVRVVQARCGTCLATEAFQRLSVLCNVRGKELEGNEPAEFRVFGLVHHTHPAAAQLLDNAIVRNGLIDDWDGSWTRIGADVSAGLWASQRRQLLRASLMSQANLCPSRQENRQSRFCLSYIGCGLNGIRRSDVGRQSLHAIRNIQTS